MEFYHFAYPKITSVPETLLLCQDVARLVSLLKKLDPKDIDEQSLRGLGVVVESMLHALEQIEEEWT